MYNWQQAHKLTKQLLNRTSFTKTTSVLFKIIADDLWYAYPFQYITDTAILILRTPLCVPYLVAMLRVTADSNR